MISLIKVLTPARAIIMLVDHKELYNMMNKYGVEYNIKGFANLLEFRTIINIFKEQIENADSKEINSLTEKYKFIYPYVMRSHERGKIDIVGNNLANKIMRKYGTWGLDKKEIVKAFLDSSELETLEDLENLEIREYTISGLSKKRYAIFNKDKEFLDLINLDENSNKRNYKIPKCLMPIIEFCMRKNLPIPIYTNGTLKKVYLSKEKEERIIYV